MVRNESLVYCMNSDTANIYDPRMYNILVEPLAGLVNNVAADSIYSGKELYDYSGKELYDYSGKELYDYSEKKGIILVCPIKMYRHTKGQRLERHHFFRSRKGQKIICKRGAIERLFDRTKDTYGIEPLAVRECLNVSSYVLACIFMYQIAIYYNCVTGRTRPQCIKHMLGS